VELVPRDRDRVGATRDVQRDLAERLRGIDMDVGVRCARANCGDDRGDRLDHAELVLHRDDRDHSGTLGRACDLVGIEDPIATRRDAHDHAALLRETLRERRDRGVLERRDHDRACVRAGGP
jgi:hypothetical protein